MYPNGYYNYRKHRKDAKQKEVSKLLNLIKETYHAQNGICGYRSMCDYLRNTRDIHLSCQTVRKYMNIELGLKSVTRKRKRQYVCKTDPYKVFENLLDRNFKADTPNSKWCMDFTYIYYGGKKTRYNCTVIDLYSRKVVASVCGNRIDTQLAINTVEAALRHCKGQFNGILHSDRGCQFTSQRFVEYCKSKGITQSMSKPGCPYDNAPMERYFNTLKTELLYQHKYETEEELYRAIMKYSYGYYNNIRPHTYNGGLPPAKVA